MLDDNVMPPPGRPAFDALVTDLRALMRRQEGGIQKAEQRRRDVSAVMMRAAEMFAVGRLSAIDISRLHALRLRLDDGLLPEERT